MKIEHKKSEFQPVTITIETPEELALLTAFYGHCNGIIAEKFGLTPEIISDVYLKLVELQDDTESPNLDITLYE